MSVYLSVCMSVCVRHYLCACVTRNDDLSAGSNKAATKRQYITLILANPFYAVARKEQPGGGSEGNARLQCVEYVCCCCTFLVFLKPAINPTLHLRLHITMPHLNVTYNTQTKRLDLKPTWLIIDNKIHQLPQLRRPRRSPTPWKYTAPFPPARRGSKDEMKLINAINLEPGGNRQACIKWSQPLVPKTDWPCKAKLVARFREDLRRLTRRQEGAPSTTWIII